MNALTILPQGAVSAKFGPAPVQNDLGAGISGGYGLIKFKGKVWTIAKGDTELKLMRPDGDGPQNSIEVVILKAATVIGKVFYEKGFTEGSDEKPDCFSANGVMPDPSSAKKQSPVCASCPKNAWGSQIKQDGTAGKGKACSDSKRLAVVPAADIKNEVFGGPMLLRVPAASLQDVATYGAAVAKLGYPYYAIVTRISFDVNEAFPKLVFSPVRALTDEEADLVLAHLNESKVDQVIAAQDATPQIAAQPAVQFEQAPAQANKLATVAPVQAQPVVQPSVAPSAQTPAPQVTAGGFVATTTAPVQAAPVQQVAQAQPAPAAKPKATKPKAAPAVTPEVTAAPAQAAGGFGAAAPVTAADAPSTAPDDFDAALDAELNSLMGTSA